MYKIEKEGKIIISSSGDIKIDSIDVFQLIENFLCFYNVSENYVLDKIDTNKSNDILFVEMSNSKSNLEINNILLNSNLDFNVKLATLIKFSKTKIENYNVTHFVNKNSKLISIITSIKPIDNIINANVANKFNSQQCLFFDFIRKDLKFQVFDKEIDLFELAEKIYDYNYLIEILENKTTNEIISKLEELYLLLDDDRFIQAFLRLFYLSYDCKMYSIGIKCINKILERHSDKKIFEYKKTIMRYYSNMIQYFENKDFSLLKELETVICDDKEYSNILNLSDELFNFKSIFSVHEKNKIGNSLNLFLLSTTRYLYFSIREFEKYNWIEDNLGLSLMIEDAQKLINSLFVEKLHDHSKMRILSIVSAKNMIKARVALDLNKFNKNIPEIYEQEIIKIYKDKIYIADFGTKIKLLTMIGECQMLYNILPYYEYKNIFSLYNSFRKELLDNLLSSEYYNITPTLVQDALFSLALQYSVVFNRKNIYKKYTKNIISEVYDYIERFNTYYHSVDKDEVIVQDLYDKNLKQIWGKNNDRN